MKWTDEELNEWLQNNSPHGWTPGGELNEQLENNSPNGWTDGELYGQLESNSPREFLMLRMKITGKTGKKDWINWT